MNNFPILRQTGLNLNHNKTVVNIYLYKNIHNPIIPMYRKFNVDIFIRFLVIMKNVLILFIREYRGPNLRPPYDVIDDVITTKNTFCA